MELATQHPERIIVSELKNLIGAAVPDDPTEIYPALRCYMESEYPLVKTALRSALNYAKKAGAPYLASDIANAVAKGSTDLSIKRHDYHADMARRGLVDAKKREVKYNRLSELKYLLAILRGNYDRVLLNQAGDDVEDAYHLKDEILQCARYRIKNHQPKVIAANKSRQARDFERAIIEDNLASIPPVRWGRLKYPDLSQRQQAWMGQSKRGRALLDLSQRAG